MSFVCKFCVEGGEPFETQSRLSICRACAQHLSQMLPAKRMELVLRAQELESRDRLADAIEIVVAEIRAANAHCRGQS